MINEEYSTYFKETNNTNSSYETGIIINPYGKEFQKREIVYYTNNTEDLEEFYADTMDLVGELDILYDLIQANLVEKVE